MEWYKFIFNKEELNDGVPVRIMEVLQKSVDEERNHMSASLVPRWYRSSVDENAFYLLCVGWDIEKEIIDKYQGLKRDKPDETQIEIFS